MLHFLISSKKAEKNLDPIQAEGWWDIVDKWLSYLDTHQDSNVAANTSGRGSRNLFLTNTPGAVGLLLLAQSKSLELQAFFLEPVVICNCYNWQTSSSSLYIRQFFQTGLTASGTF